MKLLKVTFRGAIGTALIIALLLLPSLAKATDGVTFLYSFSDELGINGPSIIQFDGKLYGMTGSGGTYGNGTIYSINTDGSGHTVLHSFNSGLTDGGSPFGDLLSYNNVFYGMTYGGGANSQGVIFSINTDGSGYEVIYDFVEGQPSGSLIEHSGLLYGMTLLGGDNSKGTVFSIEPDGSSFTILHSFVTAYPTASLIKYNGKFYGLTPSDGDYNGGVIFTMNFDGSNYEEMHSFTSNTAFIDGYGPWGNLISYDGKLYGMQYGGQDASGEIFSIDPDGSDFSAFHYFADNYNTEGGNPFGSLLEYGDILYGFTTWGGANDYGTFFSINPDGTDFAVIHTFAAGGTDGGSPEFLGYPVVYNQKLYFVTSYGGTEDKGALLSYDLPALPVDDDPPITTNTPAVTVGSETIQIPASSSQITQNIVSKPIKDSDTGGQKIISIIQPGSIIFDAYFSSNKVFKPSDIINLSNIPSNIVIGGTDAIIGIKTFLTTYWQVGKIQQMWLKTYPPAGHSAAIIVRELQEKPSIIAFKYTDEDLKPIGRPNDRYNPKNFKLAHSIDGVNWKVLDNTVVDIVNKTVAVVDKIGGYYVLVNK
jgi:uncharacterized repeat protein (TIGR03803 family)